MIWIEVDGDLTINFDKVTSFMVKELFFIQAGGKKSYRIEFYNKENMVIGTKSDFANREEAKLWILKHTRPKVTK
jgi:hypothetical protein